jgi:dolichyldiphosphatase
MKTLDIALMRMKPLHEIIFQDLFFCLLMIIKLYQKLKHVDSEEMQSLSLTHVQYESGSLLGKLLAFSSLIPIFLVVSFVTLVSFNRDLASIYFFVGQLVNEGFNFGLKRLIKQPRPSGIVKLTSLMVDIGTGYGMPSSHAQFVSFFAIYSILYLYKR